MTSKTVFPKKPQRCLILVLHTETIEDPLRGDRMQNNVERTGETACHSGCFYFLLSWIQGHNFICLALWSVCSIFCPPNVLQLFVAWISSLRVSNSTKHRTSCLPALTTTQIDFPRHLSPHAPGGGCFLNVSRRRENNAINLQKGEKHVIA